MKKILPGAGLLLLIIIAGILFTGIINLKDRHPGYKADVKIISRHSSPLRAGFAAIPITPEVPDRWTDANNDARYRPKDGDTFTDGNENGKFDPVWMAGFSNSRAANGIHDDLWARTMVLDDGQTRLAVVVLDAIGFMNCDVIDVRERIPASAGVTYTIVVSTHSHECPDLLGLWGKSPFKTGVDDDYMEYVKDQAVKSVVDAANNLSPARLEISENLTGAIPMVKDTRQPAVFDSGLRIIRIVSKEDGNTLGTLTAWGNHPETLWSRNLLVTSDFPHFFREGIEKGVYHGDTLKKQGTGGISVYINGAVGGLMTTSPGIAVSDPFSGKELSEPSFEKAEAQGKQLALLALNAMEKPAAEIDSAGISLIVRTITMPIQNKLFRLATFLGILDRGTTGWMKMRSELAVFTIGPLSFATLPGEVYPEIINGGIEAPDGADFNIEPVEVPSVRDMMPGQFKFIFGLANDETGYIIPKSQWDVRSPFTYGRDNAPYGEENSLGPETAPLIHGNLKEMLTELNLQL
jgi:hypothetical protein